MIKMTSDIFEQLHSSNYRIHYAPEEGIRNQRVRINVKKDFLNFAESQEVNHEIYESQLKKLVDLFWGNNKSTEHRNMSSDNLRSECGWRGGLLWKVEVPGHCSGIALEEGINGWTYNGHNMDSSAQALTIISLMTSYLGDIDDLILMEERFKSMR